MSEALFKKQKEQAEKSLAELQQALSSLDTLKKESVEYGIHFDALVKRFEVLFEYIWKLLKTAAEYQGAEAPGPRPAIQEAVRFGWIDDPEFWAEALDARNGSVHDYFGITPKEYLKIVERYVEEVNSLFQKLTTLIK